MAHAPTSVTRHFAALPDPRVERTKERVLLDILTSARCAVICGADRCAVMVTCAEEKATWLRSGLPVPQGIPSHHPCGRVCAALDPEAFRRCCLAWVHGVAPGTAGQVVPVDGKTLRGPRDRGRAALHLVSAWASARRLVLGRVAVAGPSNASTALPALLRLLDLAGATVTIDAPGGQTAIAARLGAPGAADAPARKDKHPTRHDDVRRTFAAARAAAFAAAVRRHWGSENRGHRVRDGTFREDGCRARVGHAARHSAALRHRARNLLRQERTCHGSLPTKRFKAALSEDYLGRVLAPLADHRAVVAR